MESFYAKEEGQKKQLSVHSYKDRDNFCISIPDKSSSDCIYLIKTESEPTVDDVIKEAMIVEGKGSPMKKPDLFEMPIIDLDCARSYQEMAGLKFKH